MKHKMLKSYKKNFEVYLHTVETIVLDSDSGKSRLNCKMRSMTELQNTFFLEKQYFDMKIIVIFTK